MRKFCLLLTALGFASSLHLNESNFDSKLDEVLAKESKKAKKNPSPKPRRTEGSPYDIRGFSLTPMTLLSPAPLVYGNYWATVQEIMITGTRRLSERRNTLTMMEMKRKLVQNELENLLRTLQARIKMMNERFAGATAALNRDTIAAMEKISR